MLLYRQISQPESVSFGGRAALRRMRAILLHNQWIGVDSSVDVSVEQPERSEELTTAQRASQQSSKPPKQPSKSNQSNQSIQSIQSNPSIQQTPQSSQTPLSHSQQTSPFFAHPSPLPLQNPSNEPKPPVNDESQDLLAFISWEDSTPIAPPFPHPPTSKTNDRKRPPSLPQPSSKRADTIQMESFLNSLFS